MDTIKEKMLKEVKRLLEELSQLDTACKEYSIKSEQLEVLTNILNEMNKTENDGIKINNEYNVEVGRLIQDKNNADNDSKNKVLDYLRLGVECVGIVSPMIFYGVWMKRGFKFEETGTYTSKTFMNLIGKFKGPK